MDLRNSIILATMLQKPESSPYEFVDYIQAPSGGPYIDTGIKPDPTIIIQCKFVMKAYDGNTFIGHQKSESDCFRFFRADTLTYLDYGSGSGHNRIQVEFIKSKTKIYNVELGNRYIKNLDTGKKVISDTDEDFAEKNYTVKLFDSTNYGIVYYLKIKKHGSWVRDYIPVLNKETNKYGLYDQVSNTFFGNNGTGDFTGGYNS